MSTLPNSVIPCSCARSRKFSYSKQEASVELLCPHSFSDDLRKTEEHCSNEREDIQESIAFVALLKNCAKHKDLRRGSNVHADILKKGLHLKNSFVASTLVSMYAKCGAFVPATETLEGLPVRSLVSWNALIAGYAQAGLAMEALACFKWMLCEGLLPDSVTFVSMLRAYGSVGALDEGKKIHYEIYRLGLIGEDVVLAGALVDMYVKCGLCVKANEVLEALPIRNAIAWNALITGYAQKGHSREALECVERMQHEGLSPDPVTLVGILRACGRLRALDRGKEIHLGIVRQGLLTGGDVVLGGALVDMYAKCGVPVKAKEVLERLPVRNAVMWNALIAGYIQQEQNKEALDCFEQMQYQGLSPDSVTLACLLRACGSVGMLEKGEKIYFEIVRQSLLHGDVVLGNAVVDMYVKCGALAKAKEVLEGLSVRDAVSWNALITGYVQGEHEKEALNCFECMQREGLFPDAITFSCILGACGALAALDTGEKIHSKIVSQGLLGRSVVLGNALVDMYAKCGALSKAKELLESLLVRDVVSWNALIAGYAQREHGKEALECFEQMQDEGLSPDEITLLCVLTACSHAGLLDEGHKYFIAMGGEEGTMPSPKHQTCMVNLFGSAGLLDKAVKLVQRMPSSNCTSTWFILLNACQKWGNVMIGRWAFQQAVKADEEDAVSYIYTNNVYAATGTKHKVNKVEASRMQNNDWIAHHYNECLHTSNNISSFHAENSLYTK